MDLRTDKLPADYWLCVDDIYCYPSYKGVHFAYDKYADVWVLYENFYYGMIRHFNASKYRIDECLDMYINLKNI